MDKFSVNSSTQFTVVEELNSEFTLVKIRVMAVGKNRNMSAFDKEIVTAHLNSLDYAPIVAHLFKDDEGNYKIGGHDMYIDWENWEMKSLCVPFGVVKAGTYDWETVNEYGTDVEYLTCYGILWTGRYPELKETIYSEDVWWNQSMEIVAKQYRPLEEDSNYMEILDFEFSALCLLYKSDNREENVEPCFIGANVTPANFATDEFATKMNEMKQAMSEVFAFEDKEGENVDDNKVTDGEIQAQVDTEPDAVSNETTPVDYEALYNESLKTIDALSEKIAEFDAQVKELTAKVNELEPFKLEAEKAEREKAESEIFAKFDNRIGDMPEYKTLKEESANYEIEQLERECMILVGKFAMSTFALDDTKTATRRFSVETVPTSVSPYGDIIARYSNK